MSEYIYRTDGAFGLNESTGEEIVRCRDCVHYGQREMRDWKTGNPIGVSCVCEREEYVFEVEPDGFCAWGERRDD